MGAFFTNYQVRAKSTSAVKKALQPLVRSRAYVSPEKSGWVTAYDESSDEQDEEKLNHIAAGLSKVLDTAVLAILVHDSDVAAYWLYQNGEIKDEFNSDPNYFSENLDVKTLARVRGSSDVLLPLCVAGTTRKDIEAIIHPADGFPVMAEEIFVNLAKLLGIDDARIGLGFTYFEEEGEEILPDAGEYEPIGKNVARKKNPSPERAKQAAPAIPDMFPVVIGMLTQCWSGKHEKQFEAICKMQSAVDGKPANLDKMLKQFRDGLDRSARDFLKHSQLPGRPTIEELKTARDSGPEALAKLLAARTPMLLPDIASSAVQEGLDKLIAALLAEGLDPNLKDHHGNSVLSAGEKLGTDSPIYQMLKSAADKNR